MVATVVSVFSFLVSVGMLLVALKAREQAQEAVSTAQAAMAAGVPRVRISRTREEVAQERGTDVWFRIENLSPHTAHITLLEVYELVDPKIPFCSESCFKRYGKPEAQAPTLEWLPPDGSWRQITAGGPKPPIDAFGFLVFKLNRNREKPYCIDVGVAGMTDAVYEIGNEYYAWTELPELVDRLKSVDRPTPRWRPTAI